MLLIEIIADTRMTTSENVINPFAIALILLKIAILEIKVIGKSTRSAINK